MNLIKMCHVGPSPMDNPCDFSVDRLSDRFGNTRFTYGATVGIPGSAAPKPSQVLLGGMPSLADVVRRLWQEAIHCGGLLSR
jgi:hypothetical protein